MKINNYRGAFTSTLISLLILSGCGGSSSDSPSSATNSGGSGSTEKSKSSDTVQISQMSTMPIVSSGGQVFYVSVLNDTENDLTLASMQGAMTDSKIRAFDSIHTDIYNAGNCTKLAAHQSCTITITPQGSSGGIALNANFVNSLGKTYQGRQVLKYGTVAAENGFRVANNELNVVRKQNQTYTLSVPFVLDNNYQTVSVDSTITPISKEVTCNSGVHTKNNSCTALLKYASGNYSNKISVSGHVAGSPSTLINTMTVNSVISNEANVLSNGLTSAMTTGSTQTITLLNAGTVAATGLTITSSDNNVATISNASGCSSLGAYGSGTEQCTFDVTSHAKVNSTAIINVSYNNGTSNVTMPINTIHIASAAMPSLDIQVSKDLNTKVGVGTDTVVTVTNNTSGNTGLNSLHFTALSSPFSFSTSGISGAVCDVQNGTTILAPQASCQIKLHYAPTAVSSGNLDFFVSAEYTEANGNVVNKVANLSIPYMAVADFAHLSANPTSTTLSIRADNSNTATDTITITNDGGIPATQMAIASFSNSLLHVIGGTCVGMTTLPNGNSCTAIVSYGPTLIAASGNENLSISYKNSTYGDAVTQTVNSQINYVAQLAAFITTTPATVSTAPQGGISGDGSTNTPYVFTPVLNANNFTLKYTYTNSGTSDATNFNVATNSLPAGFYVVTGSTTCPTGITTGLLAVGAGCDVYIAYAQSDYLAAFGSNGANITVNAPNASYSDSNTGVNVIPANSSLQKTITPLAWGTITATASNLTSESFTIQFSSVFSPNNVNGGTATITMPNLGTGFVATPSSCTVTTAQPTCEVSVAYNASLPKTASYAYEYKAVGGGIASSLPIYGRVVFPTLQ